MRADTVKRLIKIFLVSKRLNINITLEEIKKMTPEECWYFREELRNSAEKILSENAQRNVFFRDKKNN